MKNIPTSVKRLLLDLKRRLPENCRQRFVTTISREPGKLEMENTLKYAVLGGVIGALLEILPLDRITGNMVPFPQNIMQQRLLGPCFPPEVTLQRFFGVTKRR